DEVTAQIETLIASKQMVAQSRVMAQARAAKARQGAAVSTPPIGYVSASNGEWPKDSDPRVREALDRVFDLYPRLGSLNKVIKYLRANPLEFPRRIRGTV